MLHQNQNNSVLTVSSPDSNFTPRREFVRDNHVPSSFALLAIAGAGYIRLSSFPPDVVRSLRAFAQRIGVRGYKEDRDQDLYEFDLERRPWSNSKSIQSEKLFLDLLTIIIKHGYKLMSAIDYGREQDDKLSIVFSRPMSSSGAPTDSRSNTPTPLPVQVRIPFALSFASATVLRVVNPPLNSTPAILQSVRSAWPRGIISEKKVADDCYEFKLKGYKWFQEDTFAIDSLQLIMSLLSSFDHYAFSLLTSISLSGNRSRMRDIWLFCGPPQDALPDPGSSVDLHSARSVALQKIVENHTGSSQHREGLHHRTGSVPVSPITSPVQASHSRSATDPTPVTRGMNPTTGPSLLKKSSPKASSPTSPLAAPAMGAIASSSEGTGSPVRENSGSSVDMTGIGAANLYHVGKHSLDNPSRGSLIALTNRPRTGDILYSTPMYNVNGASKVEGAAEESQATHNPTSRDGTARPHADVPQSVYGQTSIKDDASEITPPILTSSRAFRDSAFSSNTRYSREIPIAWTGGLELEKPYGKMSPNGTNAPTSTYFANVPETSVHDTAEQPQSKLNDNPSPMFPGGWKPTPVAEEPEEVFGYDATDDEQPPPQTQPRSTSDLDKRDVTAIRKASPVPLEGAATRHSEAASFGMLRLGNSAAHTTPPLPSPTSQRQQNGSSPSSIGGGWVLVNVESSRAKSDPMANRVTPNGRRLSNNALGNGSTGSRVALHQQQSQPPTSMSPIAKVIVAQDAVSSAVAEENTSGIKKLFSRTKSRRRHSKSTNLR